MKNKRFLSLIAAVAILFDAALPAGSCLNGKTFTASAETAEDTSLIEVESMEEESEENQSGSDREYHSTYEFADDVVQIPEDTQLSVTDDVVTITDCPEVISEGDTFAVFEAGVPSVYVAEDVDKSGDVTSISVSDADTSEAITSMDVYEDTDLDLSYFQPAEGFEIVSVENSGASSTGIADSITIANKKVQLGDAVTVNVTAGISNLQLHQDISDTKADISITGDIDLSASLSADLTSGDGYKVFLGGGEIPGLGYAGLYVNIACEGKFTVSWNGSFETGMKYYKGSSIQTYGKLDNKGVTSETRVNLMTGITAGFSIKLPCFSGKVWAGAGLNFTKAEKLYFDGQKPVDCITLSKYLYANCGAQAEFTLGAVKKKFGKTWEIYNERNSPLKEYHHWEDGAEVRTCTRGLEIEKFLPWNDDYNSYYSDPIAYNDGMGGGKNVEPYSIFEYETLENDSTAAIITGWSGNVSDITIPETIDGYKVVGIGKEAFEENNIIKSVSMADSITEIGYAAFENCSNLTKVDLSDNLKILNNRAFANCKKLSSILIPKKLENTNTNEFAQSITGAFAECDNLKTATFENGTTTIVAYLFQYCTGLENVSIPDTVTTVEAGAFRQCKNLKAVSFPDSVTSIGREAFEDCLSLADVKLSPKLVFLDVRAFNNCDSITSIEIPKTLRDTGLSGIGGYWTGPFSDCDNLENVTFAKGTVFIEDFLFQDCYGLKSIVIPDTVTDMGVGTFYGCGNLESVVLSDSLTLIKNRVFVDCKKLKSIYIPDTIEAIYGSAFENCTSLSQVNLPKALTTIGGNAFANCESLTSITIPKGLKNTDGSSGPFSNCINLSNVNFEEGTTNIAPYLFDKCTGLVNITIPSTMVVIGTCAFRDCINLLDIVVPSSVTDMYTDIFKNCTSLRSAVLPEGRININYGTFYNCSSLESIKLPSSVQYIRGEAFYGCKSLKTVEWSKPLELIEGSAFYDCTSLTDIILPSKVKEVGSEAFKNCSSAKNAVIPDSVKKIGTGAFSGCESLESLTLGRKLETIPSEAFRYCYELTNVKLPASVKNIGSKAFGENTSLKEVDIGKNVTEIASDAFSYPRKMTFIGYADTYPQTYAEEKGITFVAKSEEAVSGDTSGDGKVNMKDLALLQQYLNGWDVSIAEDAADVNGDGKVNMKDYALLQQYLNGWDVVLK
ncbi:leucine-rich repeat protein [uncultured Ruminococcus sp.]|uniref:leucine-rich repeat protein n=1 Tax=uncultured Ruminococcus sp. TaxID=165186 RepID=UPI0025DEE374|nr:leucine-rich repeat protein [uncultured Ruminococcus sp.]